jgi:hypothetical protein
VDFTNQWAVLQRYVEDGRLAIDTTAPRTSSSSRSANWLFAGSFESARRAALLYSLLQI